MKRSVVSFCLLSLAACLAFAEKTTDVTEVGKDHFEADFASGGLVRMHVRSSELRIIGSDENKIQVHYWGRSADKSNEVKVSLKTAGSTGELRISGGPHNNFEIEIRVPRNSHLYLRVPAGDVEVSGLTGDKDVEVHAGDVRIGIGDPEDYARVDASVNAGDIDAAPFGASKSGLFRSFRKQGAGKYQLHAHVGAGDLTLRP
jgi:hypothetical protein